MLKILNPIFRIHYRLIILFQVHKNGRNRNVFGTQHHIVATLLGQRQHLVNQYFERCF
ncbi:hypothetical protein D3C86_1037510 [compost metagenome]